MNNCTGRNCVMQYGAVDPATCCAVSYCPYATPPITNYDRIITKTPEQLAMEICNDFGGIPWCRNIPECQDTPCVECVIEWLRQEADT